MSKRNFILLIIVLMLTVALILGFLYFKQKPANTGGEDPGGTNFISQFNPFGTNTPTPTPPIDVPVDEPPVGETEEMQLTKISSMPVAGFAVFSKERLIEVPIEVPAIPAEELPTVETNKKPTPPPTEFAPALRYVEKATGNIYQTFADKIYERKFSTTLIPKVHEAYFGNRGESVTMRYLKIDGRTIETFVGTLPKELLGGDITGDNEIKGSFLPPNVKDISVSPDALKIFYLFASSSNSNSGIVGTTLNFSNNKKTQIFDSQFTEWLSLWTNNNLISLSTKPSYNVPGYMYTIDSAGKNLKKVLGGINGLTTLTSPNGKLVLYSDNSLSLSVFNTDTRTTNVLGVKTLPEKCVWGKVSDIVYCAVPKVISAGQYPDTWYQGEISFRDQIWKVDIKTGNANIILDPMNAGGEEIDGIKLALDEDENYLFFINKKDSFLWKLELN